MLREIFLCTVLIAISGCDISPSYLRPIKWATVDESKIRQSITEHFKLENPYPDEINTNYEEGRREASRISQQISSINSIGSARCRELVSDVNSNKNQAPPSSNSSAYEYGIMPAQPRPMDPQEIYQRQRSTKYQECIANLENDQLAIDLKAKIAKINTIDEARRKHDQGVSEKLKTYISETASKYATEHNFDLILSRNQYEIIYNKSNASLDITDAILSAMATEQKR